MDEDDLTCRVHNVTVAEDGLVGAASIMMFITVAYIGKLYSDLQKQGSRIPLNHV